MFTDVRLRSGSGFATSTALLNVQDLNYSSAYADVGAISFSMPLSDAKTIGVDANSIIELMPNGAQVANMWFALESSQSTQTADGAELIQFNGKSLINWLTDCIVYPSTWHPSVTPSDYIISTSGSRTQTVPRNYTVVSSTVTFTDAGDLVTTPVAHNLAVNDSVQFGTITTTTGISANIIYYVKTAPTTTTFTLSATQGGAILPLTTNGTGTALTKNWPTYTDATRATLGGHSFENATPGNILQTLVARGVERGGLSWLSVSSFSGTQDSAGIAWTSTLTTMYSNGTTLLQVIQDLSARRLIDFRMDQNSLKVWNYNTQSVHYTADQITLRRGSTVTEQVRTKDAASAGTSILMLGDANALEELSDSTLQTQYGRRREQLVSQSGITDIPTLNLLAGAQLNITGHVQQEDTLAVSDTLTGYLPWVNFREGDWVWADFDGTLQNIQIQQISATQQDANNYQVGITLGDLISTLDAKNQRLIDNITGQNAGSYGALPVANDFNPPAAPSGVSAAATAYRDQNGIDNTQVTVTWAAPTTNSDGTTLNDLDHYEVQYQLAGGTSWSTTSLIPGSTVPVAAYFSNLPPGVQFNCRVRAIDSDNNASAWASSNVIASLPKVTITPSTPSTPILTAVLQGIAIQWNGKDSLGNSYDSSWARTDVYLSTVSGFTPSDSTKVGTLATAPAIISVSGLSYSSTYYAKFVVTDKSGNVSASSAQSLGVSPSKVGSGDVGFTLHDLGGSDITFSPTAPTTHSTGDLWYDSSNGYKLSEWDGTAWQPKQFGTNAISAGSITASLMAANTITAGQLAAGIVYAGIVDSTTISGAQIIAHGTNGDLLVYNGTPAANNMVLAISGNAGSDAFGNTYNEGLTLKDSVGNVVMNLQQGSVLATLIDGPPTLGGGFGSVGGYVQFNQDSFGTNTQLVAPVDGSSLTPNHQGFIMLFDPAAHGNSEGLVMEIGASNQDTTHNTPNIRLWDPNLASAGGFGALLFEVTPGVSGGKGRLVRIGQDHNSSPFLISQKSNADTFDDLQFGKSGLPGGYYACNMSWTQSIATATTTTITAMTKDIESTDYTSPWASGVFTAPVGGYYDVSMVAPAISAAANVDASLLHNNARFAQNTTFNNRLVTVSYNGRYLNAGDTLKFQVFQNGGTTVAMTGVISVFRRL